ncbi:MAG: hypothetical protein ACUVQ5_00075 [Candidatus Methanomethylicaceae archaeon]
MKQATRIMVDSCKDMIIGYGETVKIFKSLRSLAGKPGQRRSYKRLKELGMTLIFTPTPEPFSNILGLSIIGVAKYLEWCSLPLTICDLTEEGRKIFENLRLTSH